MTTRRERISRLSPEEYERTLVSSAKLASELAEAQDEQPSDQVKIILEKAKRPGQIAMEWRVRTAAPANENSPTPSGEGLIYVAVSPADPVKIKSPKLHPAKIKAHRGWMAKVPKMRRSRS